MTNEAAELLKKLSAPMRVRVTEHPFIKDGPCTLWRYEHIAPTTIRIVMEPVAYSAFVEVRPYLREEAMEAHSWVVTPFGRDLAHGRDPKMDLPKAFVRAVQTRERWNLELSTLKDWDEKVARHPMNTGYEAQQELAARRVRKAIRAYAVAREAFCDLRR